MNRKQTRIDVENKTLLAGGADLLRKQVAKLSDAILAVRERVNARHGDTANDCEHCIPVSQYYGYCNTTPLLSAVSRMCDCPQHCACFMRRL